MMAFFCGIHLIATEYIPAQRSKGEVLLFPRGQGPTRAGKQDEETVLRPEHIVRHEEGGSLGVSNGTPGGIQKHEATFHWEEISYDIVVKGKPRRLLDNVDGWVKPGTLTMLMVSKEFFFYPKIY